MYYAIIQTDTYMYVTTEDGKIWLMHGMFSSNDIIVEAKRTATAHHEKISLPTNIQDTQYYI